MYMQSRFYQNNLTYTSINIYLYDWIVHKLCYYIYQCSGEHNTNEASLEVEEGDSESEELENLVNRGEIIHHALGLKLPGE